MPPTTDVCPSSTSTVVMARCVLFSVDTFGVDNSRPLPELSSAESATSRLNAPLTEPRVNPTALVAPPAAGRFTAVPPTPAPGARPEIGDDEGVGSRIDECLTAVRQNVRGLEERDNLLPARVTELARQGDELP